MLLESWSMSWCPFQALGWKAAQWPEGVLLLGLSRVSCCYTFGVHLCFVVGFQLWCLNGSSRAMTISMLMLCK